MSEKPFIMVPDDRPRPNAERTFPGNLYFWRIAWKPKNRRQRRAKKEKGTKHWIMS